MGKQRHLHDVSCLWAHRWAGVAEQNFEPGGLAPESCLSLCCRAVSASPGAQASWDCVLHARCLGQGPSAQVSVRGPEDAGLYVPFVPECVQELKEPVTTLVPSANFPPAPRWTAPCFFLHFPCGLSSQAFPPSAPAAASWAPGTAGGLCPWDSRPGQWLEPGLECVAEAGLHSFWISSLAFTSPG